MSDAAKALRASLSEAIQVFDAQGREAEAARERAEAIRGTFARFAETCRSGVPDAERGRRWQDALKPQFSVEEHRLTIELSARWQIALCDAYDALICLNANPGSRDVVEEVRIRLRAIKLVGLDDPPVSVPDFAPAPILVNGDATGSRAAARERMLSFVERLDPMVSDTQARYEEQARRTRQLLDEALRLADSLASE
jgi:hypothetical protein